MSGLLLAAHIACGIAGLVVGPMAMGVSKKRAGPHAGLGRLYQGLTFGLCLTALGLVAVNPRVWPLATIAVETEAAALAGWRVLRVRTRARLPLHIVLMCTSYVSFVTAFLVTILDGSLLAWTLPTVVATPLIAWTAVRHVPTRARQGHVRPTAVAATHASTR